METIRFRKADSTLVIIDQTKLPEVQAYLYLKEQEQVFQAICQLQVRGAPAIGVAAAYGIYMAALQIETKEYAAFLEAFQKAKAYLASSRPTARNLFWALHRMEQCVIVNAGLETSIILEKLLEEAEQIQQEDIDACRKIGEYGLELLERGAGILTHCNAGALATSRYGTATAPMYLGQERGYGFRIFVDETRPLLQGARLTAFELQEAGMDVTLICDNMAASVMQKGWVDAVLVGCDCVTANGDVANKIGTSMVAIAAKQYQIPFYVCAPTSTIDISLQSGKDIPIEERDGTEITSLWYTSPKAPLGINVYNPAFDVTDHTMITAFITEKGVLRPPFAGNLFP